MTGHDSQAADPQKAFWSEIFTFRGSVTPIVFGRVIWFSLIAGIYYVVNEMVEPHLGIELGPFEVAGVVLGFLLVFRTNAGYDRWYEGRRLWGAIINDSRNLAVTSLTHGPEDSAWRESVIRWIAAFGHVTRATLRAEPLPNEVRSLLGERWADEVARAEHMPTFVAMRIGELMRSGCDTMGMDHFGFLQADRERSGLIDAVGSCERIQNTPIPMAYSINIRRLTFLYLAIVPFALLDHLKEVEWLTPFVMMLIAYPILAMDQIGVELQKPFGTTSLNHLPLEVFTRRIERELLQLLAASNAEKSPR